MREDDDNSDADFVEIDPTGRYGRYKEVLGRGSFKKVYRAFDEVEGIEVAWNQAKVADVQCSSQDLDRLYSEVHLLRTLKHKSIIKFYASWIDSKHKTVNIITEVFTSGTLRQYRQKHKRVDLRALKKWSRQILEGLLYLHSHDPPVIHRDLKCDNIFVNGNQGEVKIGDLGLAAILRHCRSAHSVMGTPEFMAPELYDEDYNELVDVYAFGMCLLELVTFEYPYAECINAAQIYKKVTSGRKPASLANVMDVEVRTFIEKCIANVSQRLSAKELLDDPFLRCHDEDNAKIGQLHSLHSDGHLDENKEIHRNGKGIGNAIGESGITVEGQRKDFNTIFLKLCIADSEGHVRNIHFPFDIEADTSFSVAIEMVEELDLTNAQDISTIAEMIDAEMCSHIPDWIPSRNKYHPAGQCSDNSIMNKCLSSPAPLRLERLPSGRKFWSSPKASTPANSPFIPLPNSKFSEQPQDDLDYCNEAEGDIVDIVEKLESLLMKHKQEMDDLRKKQDHILSDFLKDLDSEVCEKALMMCKANISSNSVTKRSDRSSFQSLV